MFCCICGNEYKEKTKSNLPSICPECRKKDREWQEMKKRKMGGLTMKNNYITIVFRNGNMCHYKTEEYTDYQYDGKYFIVIRDKEWIGFYNLDAVEFITVGEKED